MTQGPTETSQPSPTLPATYTAVPATRTPNQSPTETAQPSSTTSAVPKPVIAFFGDSLVEMGDVSRPSAGYDRISFAQQVRLQLEPLGYTVVVVNHGGKTSALGAKRIEEEVIGPYSPDVVTLSWGMNDLGGCEGIFDGDNPNVPDKQLLERRIGAYIANMRTQIDELLADGASEVYIMTTPPIDGRMPWTTYDPETGTETTVPGASCNYNAGIERINEAQRELAEEYAAAGSPVMIFDAHDIFDANLGTPRLYADLVHPGSVGASLLADGWIEEFLDSGSR